MKKKLSTRIFSIFLSLLMVVSILPAGAITASAADSRIQKAIDWAVSIANDNSHGYSWVSAWRTGPDYDCSSLVGHALYNGGFTGIGTKLKTMSTSTEASYLAELGFKDVTSSVNISTGNGLQAGDVLWKSGHTEMYIGNGQVVGARQSTKPCYCKNNNGHSGWCIGCYNCGELKGDQTGNEISVRAYSYWKPWTKVYRYNAKTNGGTINTTTTSSTNNQYNANAKYDIGTYKCSYKQGVNMRKTANTNYKPIGSVPYNWDIYVWKTDGNWGYGLFAGVEGWVCLDYFTKVSIPVPSAPSINYIGSENIAVGKSIDIKWDSVSGADSYTVGIRSAHVNQDINVGNSTSYTYTLSYAEKYDFYIKASNVSGSSNWSSPRNCTAHNPVTVNFVDWDDTPLGSQTIDYGASAAAPVSPERKGYSFQGWSDSYYNVTSDKTIKALYKINTYTVNFFDREGTLIDSQKVTYGSDAVPPENTNENSKYKILGWNSTDYIDVYTDRADKNINIDGVYTWYNYDLPTVCTIKSATRQYDGYYVIFDIENNDSLPTTGRAVVALKTSEGKLVDMTESTAFSIPAGKTKSDVEVFIPCNKAASSIEVFMVSDYSSGVPISPSVTASITEGLMYAESTVKPDNSDGTLDIQEVTQYSYRDKELSTGNTKTKDGWTYDGTYSTKQSSGESWSAVSAFENESQKRTVWSESVITGYNQKTQWFYSRWTGLYNGSRRYGPTESSISACSSRTYQETGWMDSAYSWSGTSSTGAAIYGSYWYNQQTRTVNSSAIYGTKYHYTDTFYTYNFYRWKTWSDWSDTEVSSSNNRDVRTRTIYRYKSNNIQPEDTSGEVRTISGNLDSSFAGKQITLYVYGYTGASDYTNEYIGQSVVADDGSYSFTFKLREEPTVKTGDFTVAIGIEGTTNTTIIDTIEAPKPAYEVNFYDWDGTVINTQTVTEGDDAVLPENPEKEGYDFVGWDKSVSNIKEDTDFYADFEKKEYTVIFINWENQQIEVRKFNHGDVLVTPEAESIEGYTFVGWDNDSAVVTKNMIVSAQYEANEYEIKFYDWNDNVIDTQAVKYGETAVVPDDPQEDGVNFADWFNPEDYQYVEHDAAIYPLYYFDETTATPTANYQTGEYDSSLQLTLSTDDENAVIYYYINDGETAEKIYTGPVDIDKTCSVTYFATSFGKNDSEIVTDYYCINTADKPTGWMLFSDIPDDVKNNLDDYVLESETGYRYKDVQITSNPDEISNLQDSGWTLEKVSYTDYTDWQDEEITVDNSLIGFEVDTQQADDTSVQWYQYSHYKYTDSNGDVQYSPNAVEGYSCEYETVTLENRLTIAGFTDDDVSFYNYDNQKWFTQTKVSGLKTQYRSRYQVAEYYKWTEWDIETPSSNEKREYETDDVYRYYNKNYHIVYIDIYGALLLVEEGKTIDTAQLDNVEGYDFKGLYTDGELTNKFDIATPITESITLFTEYSPKKYTVIFKMQDGTELDTQTIEYLSGATAPETDVVPGYVFGGWDKDFDCITEDTVITGKYFKESEYARISLDKSNVNLYQGNSISLISTITPSNLTDEKIEWSSSDPGIVSVDDTGKVTAISAGTATITAKVVKTKETAACVINVSPDDSNFIVLKSNSSLNYDDLGYLRRIGLKTSAETVSQEFTNDNLKFYNISGNELSASDYIGTGTQVRLFNGGNVVDTKSVVVTGDMTGDGIINNRDVAMMNKKLVDKVEAEECQMLAIDVNGDGYVNNRDAAMVARYLVGKDVF